MGILLENFIQNDNGFIELIVFLMFFRLGQQLIEASPFFLKRLFPAQGIAFSGNFFE